MKSKEEVVVGEGTLEGMFEIGVKVLEGEEDEPLASLLADCPLTICDRLDDDVLICGASKRKIESKGFRSENEP